MHPPCAAGPRPVRPVEARHPGQCHWYRGRIVRGRQVFPVTLLCACAGLIASGCGGARQDAHEPSGTFTLQVVKASFPAGQAVARPASLELVLRNGGSKTAPNVAVTVDSFYYNSTYPGLASRQRPIWVIEQGPGEVPEPPVQSEAVSPPGGGQTAYVNTWALGPLAAGAERTFLWRVVPVTPGRRTVHFAVAAGLAGKAKAELAGGGSVGGEFTVQIAAAPPATHVDPRTGRVVPGSYRAAS